MFSKIFFTILMIMTLSVIKINGEKTDRDRSGAKFADLGTILKNLTIPDEYEAMKPNFEAIKQSLLIFKDLITEEESEDAWELRRNFSVYLGLTFSILGLAVVFILRKVRRVLQKRRTEVIEMQQRDP